MAEISVILFYKYVEIKNPESFKQEHLGLLKELGLKGRVLVAEEGINGALSGAKEQIEDYKSSMHANPLFSDMEFKETCAFTHPFRRTQVKVRKEIVSSGLSIPGYALEKGAHIEPKRLKEWLDQQKDIVLIDMRNDYESKVGKFKGALTAGTENFRDLNEVVLKYGNLKEKDIVMYCTGGVRCEKASAMFLQNGFRNVYQLKGGILNYCSQFPDTYFEGKCFTFDSRLVLPMNKKESAIAQCEACSSKSDKYLNCKNTKCDKLFVCCDECKSKLKGYCSDGCRASDNTNNRPFKIPV